MKDPCGDMDNNINSMPLQMVPASEPLAIPSTSSAPDVPLEVAPVAEAEDTSTSPETTVQMPAEEPPAQPSTSKQLSFKLMLIN